MSMCFFVLFLLYLWRVLFNDVYVVQTDLVPYAAVSERTFEDARNAIFVSQKDITILSYGKLREEYLHF